jgi:hypothetical protein
MMGLFYLVLAVLVGGFLLSIVIHMLGSLLHALGFRLSDEQLRELAKEPRFRGLSAEAIERIKFKEWASDVCEPWSVITWEQAVAGCQREEMSRLDINQFPILERQFHAASGPRNCLYGWP